MERSVRDSKAIISSLRWFQFETWARFSPVLKMAEILRCMNKRGFCMKDWWSNQIGDTWESVWGQFNACLWLLWCVHLIQNVFKIRLWPSTNGLILLLINYTHLCVLQFVWAFVIISVHRQSAVLVFICFTGNLHWHLLSKETDLNLKLYFNTIPYSAPSLQYLNPITPQPTPKRRNCPWGLDLKFHSLSRFHWSILQMLDISCERQIKEFPLCHLYLYQSSPQCYRMLTDKIKTWLASIKPEISLAAQHSPPKKTKMV